MTMCNYYFYTQFSFKNIAEIIITARIFQKVIYISKQ